MKSRDLLRTKNQPLVLDNYAAQRALSEVAKATPRDRRSMLARRCWAQQNVLDRLPESDQVS